ncbi:MAG: hypothetical protein Q8O00_01760 [Holophaga sp.]|nr:hypothetical protein [Holophaga sp.]
MPKALEITLIVVLILLAIGILPLLFQLRRTAQGIEAFLQSSKRDLAQIAEDVHASRLRMDHLAGSFQLYLDELMGFVQLMGDMGRTAKNFHAKFSSTFDSASRNLGGIIGGISAVLAFFKNRKKPSYEEHQL